MDPKTAQDQASPSSSLAPRSPSHGLISSDYRTPILNLPFSLRRNPRESRLHTGSIWASQSYLQKSEQSTTRNLKALGQQDTQDLHDTEPAAIITFTFTADEMSGHSKKRKLDAEPAVAYYGVKAGHHPGVYTKWGDCLEQTTGYAGALFKKFTTEKDARAYIAGKVMAANPSAPAKFYGVAVGRKPGVYTDWPTANLQIQGTKGPKYKKFDTRAEAEAFVRNGGNVAKVVEAKGNIMSEKSEPPAKKARISTASSSSKSKVSSSTASEVVVNTDGSSLGNGKVGSKAGFGVFFGMNDERNVSEKLLGMPQTNQRAELAAVLRALEIVPQNQDIRIKTDSNYSIQCCTVWYVNWEKKGWKNSRGEVVMNQDLIRPIRALIVARDKAGAKTTLEWVKGHSNDPGNEAADRLAVAGARMH